MDELIQDLKYSFRTIRRRPTVSLVVVVTLGLGIGANATFFNAFYGMSLRPLPFERPQEIYHVFTSQPSAGRSWNQLSAADLEDLRRSEGIFSETGAFRRASFNLGLGDEPEHLDGAAVDAELFPLLGVEPVLGRTFLPRESQPGGAKSVVLGHELWNRRFDGAPGVLGQSLRLNGEIHEVVGVMPEGFAFPNQGRIWVPLQVDADTVPRDRRDLNVLGRLAEGSTPEAAAQSLRAVAAHLAAAHPETNEAWGLTLRPLRDAWLPPVTRLATAAQLVLVSGVLLIVCANVGNLVLVQAMARRRETALRTALGAGRRRLIRQSLGEALLLALVGGGLGLLIGSWGEAWIRGLSAVTIPYWLSFSMGLETVLYVLAITLLSALLVGFLPALRSTGGDVFEALRSGDRLDGAVTGWFRKGLVVAEYAVAVVILVTGLLMARSFDHVRRADPGFATEEVWTAGLSLAGSRYETPEARRVFLERLSTQLSARPEIRTLGIGDSLPISQSGNATATLEVSGQARRDDGSAPRVILQSVDADYFSALSIPRAAGRWFLDGEIERAAPIAVLSRSLAETLWPGQSALGRRIRPEGSWPWLEVVGLAGDVEPGELISGIDQRPRHQLYIPLTLGFEGRPGAPREPDLVIRGSEGAASEVFLTALRQEVERLDPSMPVHGVATMDEVLDRFYFAQHIWSWMFSAIAALALLIAAVGAYGVSAFSVSQRRREMAIRLALGAVRSQVQSMVIRQGLALTVAGVGLGLLTALPTARALASLIHGISPTDPGIFASVVVLLVGLGWAACYFPARRASGVEPMVTLRED